MAFQVARGDVRLPPRGDWPFIFSIGLLQMMCFTALAAFAMTALPAGRSAILSYTTLIWVAPAAMVIFGERASALRIAGVVLGVLGVAILVNPAAIDWTNARILDAHLMLLAAAFCWAICIFHLHYFKSQSSALQLAPWQMLLAAGLLVIGACIEEGPFTGDGSYALLASLVFIGPLATAFCFVAVNAASTWLPAAVMSMALLGAPVIGLVLSVLLLGEPLTPTLLSGSCAIVVGIAVSAILNRCAAPRATGDTSDTKLPAGDIAMIPNARKITRVPKGSGGREPIVDV